MPGLGISHRAPFPDLGHPLEWRSLRKVRPDGPDRGGQFVDPLPDGLQWPLSPDGQSSAEYSGYQDLSVSGRKIRVRGQVQGVGFRPFVWRLARRHGIVGEVLNDPEGVLIFAAGDGLDAFEMALRDEAPPLARIDEMEREKVARDWPAEFEIAASKGRGAETRVTPDAATCCDCVAEIRDPGDRRFGYAFTNCTHCGPRFSILRGLPYDRARTTMEVFPMCDACAAEYADPSDRRFHAQPIACPDCGPRIWIEPAADDPIAEAARRLQAGEVLAIKGLGGFHLACDATDAAAVETLRARKRRPAKPLALMGTPEMIAAHCAMSHAEMALLTDPAAPIVVLERVSDGLCDALAPGLATLGWMLPSTPLHHLLLDAVGRPLVMTSGNQSGAPQVIGNAEAREKLGAFVDAFLMHDRDIARRLDDSVEREDPPMVLRRARGRVPGTLTLPRGFADAPQVLAYGGQMKGAICLLKSGQALLGHHLGEMDQELAWEAFLDADRDFAALFNHRPEAIAVDLHPEFRPTRHGQARAMALGLPLVAVQHHHAHLAACLGENGWPLEGGPVAGIILDGLGFGLDGTIWGGEILLGDYRGFERIAWLRPAPLIGGDRAQAEPWRNALVRLDQAGLSSWADTLFPAHSLEMARRAAEKGLNAPPSSSAGRLFDAVAAILGICPDGQSYEGEAAMRLEALAARADQSEVVNFYNFAFSGSEIDPAPLWTMILSDLADGVAPETIALRFHSALARCVSQPARDLVHDGVAQAVTLSGGCFQNAVLQRLVLHWLRADPNIDEFPVLIHRTVPANDGGLAFGQALVAAAQHISASVDTSAATSAR